MGETLDPSELLFCAGEGDLMLRDATTGQRVPLSVLEDELKRAQQKLQNRTRKDAGTGICWWQDPKSNVTFVLRCIKESPSSLTRIESGDALLKVDETAVFKKGSLDAIHKLTTGPVDHDLILVVRRHKSDADERHVIPIRLDVVDPADVKGCCLVLRKRHRDIFGKSWKLRWVVVQGDRVGVFKKESETEAKYWLDLPSCEVIEEEVVNKRYKVDKCIGVSNHEASFYFTVDIRDEKNHSKSSSIALLPMSEFVQVLKDIEDTVSLVRSRLSAHFEKISDPSDCPISADSPQPRRKGRDDEDDKPKPPTSIVRPRKDAIDRYVEDIDRQEKEEIMAEIEERQDRRKDAAKEKAEADRHSNKPVNNLGEEEARKELFGSGGGIKKGSEKKGGKSVSELDEEEARKELFGSGGGIKKGSEKKGGKSVRELDEEEPRKELFGSGGASKMSESKVVLSTERSNAPAAEDDDSDRDSLRSGAERAGLARGRSPAPDTPPKKPPPTIEPAAGIGAKLRVAPPADEKAGGLDESEAVRPFSPMSPDRPARPGRSPPVKSLPDSPPPENSPAVKGGTPPTETAGRGEWDDDDDDEPPAAPAGRRVGGGERSSPKGSRPTTVSATAGSEDDSSDWDAPSPTSTAVATAGGRESSRPPVKQPSPPAKSAAPTKPPPAKPSRGDWSDSDEEERCGPRTRPSAVTPPPAAKPAPAAPPAKAPPPTPAPAAPKADDEYNSWDENEDDGSPSPAKPPPAAVAKSSAPPSAKPTRVPPPAPPAAAAAKGEKDGSDWDEEDDLC